MSKYPIKKEFFPFSHFTQTVTPQKLHRCKQRKVASEPCYPLAKIDEAYELFENKRDGVIKVAVEC